jgi:hypothetical protein
VKSIGALLVCLVLVSCSAQNNAPVSPAGSPTHPAASPTTQSSESSSPASKFCPNPEGGSFNTCLGDLKAGTYHTQTFHPPLTYAVPPGWSNQEDLLGNFLLLPPGATLEGVNPGTSDYLGVYTSVVAPGLCTGAPSSKVKPTFDGLVGWLTSHPRLEVSNVHNVTVGGLKGVALDIAMKSSKGDGCPEGVSVDIYVGTPPSDLIHGVIPGYLVRAYLLHNRSHTLAIEVADARHGSDYKDWLGAAARVIDSFKFAAH